MKAKLASRQHLASHQLAIPGAGLQATLPASRQPGVFVCPPSAPPVPHPALFRVFAHIDRHYQEGLLSVDLPDDLARSPRGAGLWHAHRMFGKPPVAVDTETDDLRPSDGRAEGG